MNNQEFFEKVGTDAPPMHRNQGVEMAAQSSPQPDGPNVRLSPTTGAKRWAASHDTFWGATQTYDQLPAGLYRCGEAPNIGPTLHRIQVETDNLISLPDDDSEDIIAEFKRFWEVEDEFRKRGFLMKRGFLLWGPPGSGKTSTIQLLIKELIEHNDGIVLLIEYPALAAVCLQMVRQIEPKRPIIAVMEDVDALIERFGENQYLALLDGEAQVDNIVFLASTNYPERLDRRFVDRPSRFDTVRYIGMPSAKAREVYLQIKEPSLEGNELAEWVASSDGFSIAHLKEMIIAVKCFGQSLSQVTERLEAMHSRKPTSEDTPERSQVGFGVVRSAGRLGRIA